MLLDIYIILGFEKGIENLQKDIQKIKGFARRRFKIILDSLTFQYYSLNGNHNHTLKILKLLDNEKENLFLSDKITLLWKCLFLHSLITNDCKKMNEVTNELHKLSEQYKVERAYYYYLRCSAITKIEESIANKVTLTKNEIQAIEHNLQSLFKYLSENKLKIYIPFLILYLIILL